MTHVGVDTGGTFTDFVAIDGDALRVEKRPSTPPAPERAVVDGLGDLAVDATTITHGTTVATNAVLERSGARTALVTTRGFRDTLEIGRGDRAALYDLAAPRPEPFVPASRRFEVDERLLPRLDRSGIAVHRPLDRAAIDDVVERVRRARADAIAVCLLHAYADPRHERRLARALRTIGVPVSVSHELVGEFREYERTSTTVLNAFVQPKMASYLGRLERALAPTALRVMQSGGGAAPVAAVSRAPVRTLLSGPVGGVLGALALERAAERSDLITLDMGGTSTDVSLVRGTPTFTRSGEIAGVPVQTPMIDVHTIGAGGGSIARRDRGGALRVGPESAGAQPGPIAYGRGGEDVTVTDANVYLRRLDVAAPLAGGVALDRAAVSRGMRDLAASLGVTPQRAARGVVDVVNNRMARAVRAITLARGHDPRAFTLVAFGGAAGLHAADLADLLGIRRVSVPAHAGALSAYGLLTAPPSHEVATTVLERVALGARPSFSAALGSVAAEATAAVRADRPRGRIAVARFLDCRYVGQSFELTIPYARDFRRAFDAAHEHAFGFATPDRPLEVVNVRARATGAWSGPPLPTATDDRPRDERPGRRRSGPAAVRFPTCAVWIPDGWRGTFDAFGGIVLERTRRR